MALGSFITALKVVPWGDVITAAPAIVKGARKMFSRTEDEPAPVVPPGADPNERLRLLEVRLQEMADREQASAKLIAALAEQNAAVVDAIGVLRARARWLVALNAVLLVLLAAGLVLSYGRFGGG
ncbi:hypothetical protein [Rhizobacter sp. Root1221]|uniref:hypothetical protein n=1 Tax=Rhizobacter sp. Root1221 TaxID=1736433 RepID=UPI0006FB34EC|nr:hypothetical protein [Rhizobacter sp. Root1221]KQV91685.1 hypothetical protein ASC87_06275 [Rhizobacter sp. Root1221]